MIILLQISFFFVIDYFAFALMSEVPNLAVTGEMFQIASRGNVHKPCKNREGSSALLNV